MVRQHGGFSFARVFDAGHLVPAYQPATAAAVFERAVFGRDVATGTVSVLEDGDDGGGKNGSSCGGGGGGSGYSTVGPASSFAIKNVLPPDPPPVCYLFNAPGSCTGNQLAALAAGTAVVKDYIVVDPAPDVDS